MRIRGNVFHARLERLRGLVARSGAEIEKALAGMQIEQRNDGLRSDVLHAAGARDIGLGRLQKRMRDLVRSLAPELGVPAREQPLRAGELRGAVGPGAGIAVDLAKD